MSDYGGYIKIFTEIGRSQFIQEVIETYHAFVDAVSERDWRPDTLEIFLLSFDGRVVSFASLATRGIEARDGLTNMHHSELVRLEPAIDVRDIEDHIPDFAKVDFRSRSTSSGGRLLNSTWESVFGYLKSIQPKHIVDGLDRLEALRVEGRPRFTGNTAEIVAQERDSVNLAARMSGFRQDILRPFLRYDHIPPDNNFPPFLSGLSKVNVIEDRMIDHDIAALFRDWRQFERFQVGAQQFERGRKRLTVMNINRDKLEKTTGVDLLFYHENQCSYILVQYKRMTEENYGGAYRYRPTDKSYREELARMRALRQKFPSVLSPTSLDDYRLSTEMFYFKLCKSVTLTPLSTEPIDGMFVPLDYWELFVDSPQAYGLKSGLYVDSRNIGRSFNNAEFTGLIEKGWIGSRGITSMKLDDLIWSSLERGNSVMIGRGGTVKNNISGKSSSDDEE